MPGLQEAEAVIKSLLAVPDQSEGNISDQSEGLLCEDVGAGWEDDVDHPGHICGAHLYCGVAKADLERSQPIKTHFINNLPNQGPTFDLLTNERPLH